MIDLGVDDRVATSRSGDKNMRSHIQRLTIYVYLNLLRGLYPENVKKSKKCHFPKIIAKVSVKGFLSN